MLIQRDTKTGREKLVGDPIGDIQTALNKTGVSLQQTKDAEKLARIFHETYERLAPAFDYKTSAKPWEEVPEQNRKLMIAVCEHILSIGI